jgi:prepilin-type N-terminal cleavage/methylation domain-containing protein
MFVGLKNGRSRSGFTLIELLVVIAIIAILAAILFRCSPVHEKTHAAQVACPISSRLAWALCSTRRTTTRSCRAMKLHSAAGSATGLDAAAH